MQRSTSYSPHWLTHYLTSLLTYLLTQSRKKIKNICQYWCWASEIWYVASLDTIIRIQEEENFLYVCQSVSWLTFLLKLDIYRDISSSWWEIFLIWETFLGFCYNSSNFFWISGLAISLFVGLLPYWKGQVLVIQRNKGGCRTSLLAQWITTILLHLPAL